MHPEDRTLAIVLQRDLLTELRDIKSLLEALLLILRPPATLDPP